MVEVDEYERLELGLDVAGRVLILLSGNVDAAERNSFTWKWTCSTSVDLPDCIKVSAELV